MADLTTLQAALDAYTAQATATKDAEDAAEALISQLGALIAQNATDPAAIQAIADAMTNNTGTLTSSAAALAAAIVAGTPAA